MGTDLIPLVFDYDTPIAVVPVVVAIGPLLATIISAVAVAAGGALISLFKPQTMKKLALVVWSQKISVLLIAGAVVGTVSGWPYVFPPKVVAGAAEGEWLAFRGGPERRGSIAGDKDPVQGGILWNFTASKIFYSSPTVVGDRLYATSAKPSAFDKTAGVGYIYCVNANTGEQYWKHREGGDFRATFSSPAIAGGGKYLVCGEGLHFTEDARVFCFDISKAPTKVWEYRTKSHVESSPCIANGKVYIGAGDDGYYCFALEPKEKGKAEVIWHLPGPKSDNREGAERIYYDAETCPIVVDGKVYFGLGIGGMAVCCVDAETGKELWRVDTPYPAFSSPTISNGKLFFGMGNGDFVNRAETARALKIKKMEDAGATEEEIKEAWNKLGAAGEVWCIDLKTHEVEWKYDVGRTVLGSIAAKDGRLYFGSRNGFFYCLSMEGKLIKRFNVRKPIVTSPALGKEYVYFMTEAGRVYGLDMKTLDPVWEVSLGQGALFISSPALGNGHLYVGTDGSGIACAGEPSDVEREVLWAGHRGGPDGGGYGGGGTISARGAYGWKFPSEEGAVVPSISAPPAFMEDAMYVGLNTDMEHGLAKIVYELTKTKDGKSKMGPVRKWLYKTGNMMVLSAAVSSKGKVYCVDGKKGDAGRNLHCLDSATGMLKWKHPVEQGAEGMLFITGDAIFAADRKGSVVCLDRKEEGKPTERWRADVGNCARAPYVFGDIVVMATSSTPRLSALDFETGKILWRSDLPSAPQTDIVIARFEEEIPKPVGKDEDPKVLIVTDDVILLGLSEGLMGYSLLDGKKVWSVPCGSVQHLLRATDRLAACVNASSELVMVDFTKGKEVRRIPDVVSDVAPMRAGDALLFYERPSPKKESIQRWDLSNIKKNPKQWMKTSWLGAIKTHLVGTNSHMYFTTDKRGLVCARPRKR